MGCGMMNEREAAIRFVLEHPELIDRLEKIALLIEMQKFGLEKN